MNRHARPRQSAANLEAGIVIRRFRQGCFDIRPGQAKHPGEHSVGGSQTDGVQSISMRGKAPTPDDQTPLQIPPVRGLINVEMNWLS